MPTISEPSDSDRRTMPATPAASGEVEAARAALLDRLQPLLAGEHYEAVRAMMAFEAAIRAEAGGLDVERLVRDERNPYDEGSEHTSEAMLAIGFEKCRAAVLARLAEEADD